MSAQKLAEDATHSPAVEMHGIRTQFGAQPIHDELELVVQRGEMLSLIGGSGTGKSVMLRMMCGIMKPQQGQVKLLGQELYSGVQAAPSIGVLFQSGALFTSLTVSENIQVAIKARHDLPRHLLEELAAMKISLVGLPCEAGAKTPDELSGGMIKRAGLARALALDPDVLFLDEPTAGLDPVGASDFDSLIETLREHLGLTVIMITHDIDSLKRLSDRIAVLVDRKATTGTIDEITALDHPWIKSYFGGVRGRAAGLTSDESTVHASPMSSGAPLRDNEHG